MEVLSFVIGLVKLKRNFYVVINPNWISLDHIPNESVKECERKMELLSLDIWGEGTTFKVLQKNTNYYSLEDDANVFKKQIECYQKTCLELGEEDLIDEKDIAEKNMIAYGMPFCFVCGNAELKDDYFLIMTKSDFERIVMPEIEKSLVNFSAEGEITKEDVLKLSKTICNCYRRR